jgi:lipoprotein-anchoring transpeptidase ErfK/SrfK
MLVVASFGLAAWAGYSSLPVLAETTGLFPSATLQIFLAARANQLTHTPTLTPSPTATLTPTPTPRPTRTPRPPTATPVPAYGQRPWYVGPQEIWIEIDLGAQQMFVRQGEDVLRTFWISSGTWATPTVTGSFQIFNKINTQNMAGTGYYLPDVPYVMYFYEDFAIHGAYWHNNFGTPMSHGCVNMDPDEASWVYRAAEIGTWVIIHY